MRLLILITDNNIIIKLTKPKNLVLIVSTFGYCYHLFDVIGLILYNSDKIKQLIRTVAYFGLLNVLSLIHHKIDHFKRLQGLLITNLP